MNMSLEKSFREFMFDRQEAALKEAMENPEFIELCNQYNKLMDSIDVKLELKIDELSTKMDGIQFSYLYRQGFFDGLQFMALQKGSITGELEDEI